MKSLLLAALLISAPIAAQEMTPKKICANLHKVSGEIMKARQLEKPVTEVIDALGETEAAQQLIMEAYKRPAFSTEKYRIKAAKKFANETYVGCMFILLGGE